MCIFFKMHIFASLEIEHDSFWGFYPSPPPQRIELASEFAVSQVFSKKKPRSETKSQAVPLQSMEQLRDHDDAYSEGQQTYNKKVSREVIQS